MIYTGYFAKIKTLPSDIVPISICGKAPDWYTGLQYKKLAPKYDFFMEWKRNHDNAYYVKCYNEQVLANLNVSQVVWDLFEMANGGTMTMPDVCLICYETPEDFCHRHLVAEWLRSYGYEVKEWDGKEVD